MIDIETESLVLLKELAKDVPKRNGKPVAISTLRRWSTAGVKGVQLETILVGGQRYSSLEAFRRFVAAGNQGKVKKPDQAKAVEETSRALEKLDRLGW